MHTVSQRCGSCSFAINASSLRAKFGPRYRAIVIEVCPQCGAKLEHVVTLESVLEERGPRMVYTKLNEGKS